MTRWSRISPLALTERKTGTGRTNHGITETLYNMHPHQGLPSDETISQPCLASERAMSGGLLLSTAYLAPVQQYAHLYHCREVREEHWEHYTKQTFRNRCYIATAEGRMALTIPVEHDYRQPIHSLRIADHGRWQAVHWNALQTAYDASPFFEYYEDDFRPLYQEPFERLVDFNTALQQTVLNLLELPITVRPTTAYETSPMGVLDLRETIRPKHPQPDPRFRIVPYYQVFAHRTGFLPNLSIIDLLFNMGPESRLVLRNSINELT